MTATTPSMRAVRFETGLIELELSNRIQCKAQPGSSSYLKLFGKCQVDLNLALGQIVKHQVEMTKPISAEFTLLNMVSCYNYYCYYSSPLSNAPSSLCLTGV